MSGQQRSRRQAQEHPHPQGNVYLKTALAETAQSAAGAKGTYLRDKFCRLKPLRGYKRAAVAVAHKILVAIYHMLSSQVNSTNSARLPGHAQ
jgi:transposase